LLEKNYILDKKITRVLIKGTIISTLTFFLLELTLFLYVEIAGLKIELPTYTFENTHSFWFDINKDFGTGHLPLHSYRQKKTCFDVLYEANAHGFRDKERHVVAKKNRVLTLGDSFIEGIGVGSDARLSNLLENETNVPHLNFGTAGNFGPTQYFMLYKSLAIHYSHDAILVGVLPSNDFIDDDYEINLKVGSNRYRPFLDGVYPNYKIVYHQDSLHKSKVTVHKQRFIGKVLKNFTYSYNMYLYVRTQVRMLTLPKKETLKTKEVPSYFNYTKKQLNRMKFSLEQIKVLAKNKPVMVFTIPNYNEILEYRRNKKNPLAKELMKFCRTKNIEYLDLLEPTKSLSLEECEALFLSCDGHWSEAGNAYAKKQIKSYFEYYEK